MFQLVTTQKQLTAFVRKIKILQHVAVDTETTGSNPQQDTLVGISLATDPETAVYIPIQHQGVKCVPLSRIQKILGPVLADPNIEKSGHNFKWDLQVLARFGFPVRGLKDDTKLMSYILEPHLHKHTLDALAKRHLGKAKGDIKALLGRGKKAITMDLVPIEDVTEYACLDAALVEELVPVLRRELHKAELHDLYYNLEMPLTSVLADMEFAGVCVDLKILKELEVKLEVRVEELVQALERDLGKINLNSPQQLGEVLFTSLELPIIKTTKKGANSTDSNVLEALKDKHPVIPKLLEYRQLQKLLSTYIKAIPELINPKTGRVHTSLNQAVAATGRLSSSHPNLQNIPARSEYGKVIRTAFIPAPGHVLIVADYSQIELRLLAHMCGDLELQKCYLEGRDVHAETAKACFGNTLDKETARFRAKIINFSINYGTSARSLAAEIGTTVPEAQHFINKYFWKYPRVREFHNEMIHETKCTGYSVTILGRRREVPEIHSPVKALQAFGCRVALNHPIQGSAADVIKLAMINLDRALKAGNFKTRMLLQVHDELIFEAPKKEVKRVCPVIKQIMEDMSTLPVPLSVPMVANVGTGPNWTEAKV